MKMQNYATPCEDSIQFVNAPMLARSIASRWQMLINWACSTLNTGSRFWFCLMWSFIGAVSTYDAYLGVRYWDSMPNLELNPICLYLIEHADGDASVFLSFKAAGTVLVLTFMALFYVRSPKLAQHIAWGVSSFQLGLLLYLTLG